VREHTDDLLIFLLFLPRTSADPSPICAYYREYGLSISELGYDPCSTSNAKTRRIMALTGGSGSGPAIFSETA
jgi:hypothetical protein